LASILLSSPETASAILSITSCFLSGKNIRLERPPLNKDSH